MSKPVIGGTSRNAKNVTTITARLSTDILTASGRIRPKQVSISRENRLLDAYRIVSGNDTIYNLYNLLRGEDNWDPCRMKEQILFIEKSRQRNLSTLPVKMGIIPTQKSIETGKGNITLTAMTTRYGCKPDSSLKLVVELIARRLCLRPYHTLGRWRQLHGRIDPRP